VAVQRLVSRRVDDAAVGRLENDAGEDRLAGVGVDDADRDGSVLVQGEEEGEEHEDTPEADPASTTIPSRAAEVCNEFSDST